MSTYAELTARLQDTVEKRALRRISLRSSSNQAEQRLYQAVQIPALRKNQTASADPEPQQVSVASVGLPVRVLTCGGQRFGRLHVLARQGCELHPGSVPIRPPPQGLPKFYAIFDKDTLILGPTPDDDYMVEMHYGYYPESIVTAGTTWLSENYEAALFNGVLLEAATVLEV
jgi:hypothetical protein